MSDIAADMEGENTVTESAQKEEEIEVISTRPDENIKGYDNERESTVTKENVAVSEKDHTDNSLKYEEKDDEGDEKRDTEKPLLEEESIRIDLAAGDEGEDTPTLPLPEKKKRKAPKAESVEEEPRKRNLPKYLFPISRMKRAWNESSNILEFLGRAFCIIFSTLGWFTCVGGIPFISLAMLVIGSVYVNDCRKEPNIPVYLIVTGVFGTLQHIISIWTKYVPKNSQGRLKVYRSYCNVIDCLLTLFLMIWFVLGCIWVYGAYDDVNLRHPDHEEYCNKTLYNFAFWLLNLTFILLAAIVVLSICFVICIIATPKENEKGVIQA